MEITVSELAALIGGQLAEGADGSVVITGAASLYEAMPGDVTFYQRARYLPLFRACQASAALVPMDFSESVGPVCIRCENPSEIFTKVVAHFSPPPLTLPKGIHPTAIIADDVQLGDDVSIHAYAVIESGARIGARTVIGAHAYIGQQSRLGDDCLLHPRVTISERCLVGHRAVLHSGVVLGADGFGFRLIGGKHVKTPQTGIVQVDDDVEIGANSCVDRARFGRTWIQSGTKIDNQVQIGHNVVVGQNSILCGQVGIAGSVKVGNYVTLAGQVGVNGHLEIGDGSLIAGQGGVYKTVPPKQVLMGSPAVPERQWKKRHIEMASIGDLKRRLNKLERALKENGLIVPPEDES